MILLDARMVGPRPHGIARYAIGLVPALHALCESAQRATRNSLHADSPFASGQTQHAAALAQDPPLAVLVAAGLPQDSPLRSVPVIESRVPLYSMREQIQLPPLIRRIAPDLVHSLTYSAPLAAGVPVIPTIHDLIHLRFPEHHGAIHRLYYAHVVGPVARRAPRVITVSEASADAISEHLRVARERIIVTPLGVDARFLAATDEDARRARDAHRLPSEFLLYVGNERPHKNAAGAIRIREVLARDHGLQIPLVLLGVSEEFVASIVKGGATLFSSPDVAAARAIRQSGTLPGSIVPLRDVPDTDLAGLYRAARALVMPSLDEGFGLPALEAMAAGTPVVAARRGGLPEIVGDEGLLEDPSGEPAFAAAVARVVRESDLASTLSERGRARAARFTWQATARRTLETYRAALDEIRGGP